MTKELNVIPTLENQVDFVEAICNKLRTQLENEKARIYAEIGNYPTPIAGCDQQFNYLLEEQRGVLAELARLKEAANESLTAEDALKRIDEFIQSSSYVDAEIRRIWLWNME